MQIVERLIGGADYFVHARALTPSQDEGQRTRLPESLAGRQAEGVTGEKRQATRKRVEVKVDYRTVGRFTTNFSRDLSACGVFIPTWAPLAEGERVRLRFTTPDGDLPFALDGEVRWVSTKRDARGPGMGIEFSDADAGARARVEALLDSADPT